MKQKTITRKVHAQNRAKSWKIAKATRQVERSEYLEAFNARPSGRFSR